MPDYNHEQYQPPAPVASVRIVAPLTGNSLEDVPFLLDTGADVSLIPASCAEALAVVPDSDRFYEIEGYEGGRTILPTVVVRLEFNGLDFTGAFLVADRSDGILGRNILNQFPLLLNGPALVWTPVSRSGT
jgi:hypothetical protein